MWQGKQGRLRGRTFSAPRKWARGKGRITCQFGCCYNYAVDSDGRKPGEYIHTPRHDYVLTCVLPLASRLANASKLCKLTLQAVCTSCLCDLSPPVDLACFLYCKQAFPISSVCKLSLPVAFASCPCQLTLQAVSAGCLCNLSPPVMLQAGPDKALLQLCKHSGKQSQYVQ